MKTDDEDHLLACHPCLSTPRALVWDTIFCVYPCPDTIGDMRFIPSKKENREFTSGSSSKTRHPNQRSQHLQQHQLELLLLLLPPLPARRLRASPNARQRQLRVHVTTVAGELN